MGTSGHAREQDRRRMQRVCTGTLVHYEQTFRMSCKGKDGLGFKEENSVYNLGFRA